jgi:plastocyanin
MRKRNFMLNRRHVLMAAVLALPVGAGAAAAETLRVTIDRMAFSPAEIQAKAGDTIEWINNDAFAHTATVKGGFEVMLPPKTSGSMVMEKAGTVDYYCRFHPNMKGRIEVAP